MAQESYVRRLADLVLYDVRATEPRIGVLSGNRDAKRLCRQAGLAAYLELLAKRVD